MKKASLALFLFYIFMYSSDTKAHCLDDVAKFAKEICGEIRYFWNDTSVRCERKCIRKCK